MTHESRTAYEHHIPPVAELALLSDVPHAPMMAVG